MLLYIDTSICSLGKCLQYEYFIKNSLSICGPLIDISTAMAVYEYSIKQYSIELNRVETQPSSDQIAL